MIRIHCATHEDADALWRMLTHVPDDAFHAVTVDVDGHGSLFQITRQDGQQTSVRLAVAEVQTHPA
jgi:hypothetical protein